MLIIRSPSIADRGFLKILGTNENDIILSDGIPFDDSTGRPDEIYAFDGDDLIFSRGGDDTIEGGAGDDTIESADGADLVYGDDKLGDETGDDDIQSGRGNDTVYGGKGNDDLRGGEGNDIVDGGKGDDSVVGGSDNDTLIGGEGNDTLEGKAGDDRFEFSGEMFGDDTIEDFNDPGDDTAAFDFRSFEYFDDNNDDTIDANDVVANGRVEFDDGGLTLNFNADSSVYFEDTDSLAVSDLDFS